MQKRYAENEVSFDFRLFCKTVSNSATWGFDRFRLYGGKVWCTMIQVQRPDGSILATKRFLSDEAASTFEHDFSFDLSENVNKEEYQVLIAGVVPGTYYQQNYAYPTGWSATYGRNAEITWWDLNQVSIGGDYSYNNNGRIKWENQPLDTIKGLHLIKASVIKVQNCQLDASHIDQILVGLYNNNVIDPNNVMELDYSGNPGVPTNASKEAYDYLVANGWTITGQAPPSTKYLLDENVGAIYGHSFRLLSSTYTGPCIRIRRSSDNLETDIGFVDGYVDKTAILNHCGAGHGFVVTKYDQTGNGRHLMQTAAGDQPYIVMNGVLNESNGFVYLRSGESLTEHLKFTFALGSLGAHNEYFAGVQPNDSTAFILSSTDAGTEFTFVGKPGDTSKTLTQAYGAPILRVNGVDRAPVTRGDVYNIIATGVKSLIIHRNGDLKAWTNLRTGYPNTLYSGLRQAYERVAYPDATKEASVEANINSYYTIY